MPSLSSHCCYLEWAPHGSLQDNTHRPTSLTFGCPIQNCMPVLDSSINILVHPLVTQRFVSLCPQVHWGRPDIWLGLVSLGSEGLSCPRCGIYCKGLTKQSYFYHLQYLFTQQYINITRIRQTFWHQLNIYNI